MIFCTQAIVLARKPISESDRWVVLYTEVMGKLHARCTGVQKPAAKLKALTEPFVAGDYRIYLRPGAESGRIIGGKLLQSFPGIRQDLARIQQAYTLCELMSKLTPDHQPNRDKYILLLETLNCLETTPSPWVLPAYTLRLLSLTGFGATPPHLQRNEIWANLQTAPWPSLACWTSDPAPLRAIQTELNRLLEQHLDSPLKTTQSTTHILA
ncbi:MAG: DNA repair protein RecO [Elusimicrobia bacterium]|nr:DNA repair protein RecO [Elusimicrobiota bacterium]